MKPEPRVGTFSGPPSTPADRIMAELPGVYYRLTEVAAMLNVSESTLRRHIRKGVSKAPSQQIVHGGMRMYLYTPDDVEELRRLFGKEVDEVRKA